MHIQHLNYLLDLQKTRSLSKTAENHFTSRQVVNNAIKSLEDELHVTILNRTHKGVLFTDAGLLVCDHAQKIISEQQLLLQNLTPYSEFEQIILKGDLDFFTIPRFSNKHFLKFFTNYCRIHDRLNINLKTISFDNFFNLHNPDNPFIFLVTAHSSSLNSQTFIRRLLEHEFTYEIIQQERLGICVAKNSPWLQDALGYTPGSTEVTSLPFVVHTYALDDTMLLSNETFCDNLYLTENFESQKQLIKSGNYLGLCTPTEFRYLFQSKDNSFIFIPDFASKTAWFYYIAIYHKNYQEHLVLQDILSSLKKFYR